MLGRKGQAFDAFKLLIAAVVAGSILVIILSMLGGINPTTSDPLTVMAQSVQSVRGAPGSGTVSTQVVQFQTNQIITSKAIETKAGVNPGTVHFCTESVDCDGIDACPEDYIFNEDYFEATENSVQATTKIGGKVWVFNCDGDYYIGFTTKGV